MVRSGSAGRYFRPPRVISREGGSARFALNDNKTNYTPSFRVVGMRPVVALVSGRTNVLFRFIGAQRVPSRTYVHHCAWEDGTLTWHSSRTTHCYCTGVCGTLLHCYIANDTGPMSANLRVVYPPKRPPRRGCPPCTDGVLPP